MREVIGLGQLRSHALGYLDRVGSGETIEVIRRGKLVARMVSASDWKVAPLRPATGQFHGTGRRRVVWA